MRRESSTLPGVNHGGGYADSAGAQLKRIGRYDLLCKLASGGMGSVYLARASGVGGFERLVALKSCHPELLDDSDFVAMFMDEARLAAQIRHPNVVPTLDVGDDDVLHLVMEYVEGDDLLTVLNEARKKGEKFPIDVTLRIMVDLLAGLHAAHELRDGRGRPLNLIHRDVSPHNVMVGVDGSSRLTDFGLAKAEARVAVTRQGVIKGKLGYVAPEQVSGKPATRQVDVFAAGVVIWEALVGRRLFHGETERDMLMAVIQEEIKSPAKYRKDIPKGLEAAIMKALAREPSQRFATAADFSEALETCGAPVASARGVSAVVKKYRGEVHERRRALIHQLLDAAVRGQSMADLPWPTSVEQYAQVDQTRIIETPWGSTGDNTSVEILDVDSNQGVEALADTAWQGNVGQQKIAPTGARTAPMQAARNAAPVPGAGAPTAARGSVVVYVVIASILVLAGAVVAIGLSARGRGGIFGPSGAPSGVPSGLPSGAPSGAPTELPSLPPSATATGR